MKITEPSDLRAAVEQLIAADPYLSEVYAMHGMPPVWKRPETFATLLTIILEQQVSLDSARATFQKLAMRLGSVEPAAFLELDESTLKLCGFSRQKTRYGRELARAIVEGSLDLDELDTMPDDEVFAKLTAIVGIGRWTADIYRLMAMGSPDVWPLGDIALAQSLAEIHGLEGRPGADAQLVLVERWRPFRSVAARLLWLKYLRERGRSAEEF